MLPVKLTLEGIYSYRERQTIDFTRLTEARLFGIFGPVGSGKSTILDAMIYVIYGTIDRLNNEVKYNLMNLQSNRLFVDFEFRAEEDGRLYRATVESRRNKKKFTDVSSPKYLYHVREGDEWLPCTREEVIDAIGLNVQNFKRVVIIPQGKFQEFLLLRDKERTDMMMELFGELRRYDLGGRVAYLEGETIRRVIDLRGQLTGLGEVSAEQLAERKEEYAGVREESARVKKEIADGQKEEERLKKVKQLVDELDKRKAEKDTLDASGEEFKLLQSRVCEHERFVERFLQPLNQYEEAERRANEAAGVLANYWEVLRVKREELTAFSEHFSRLKQEYEQRDGLRERAERLGLLLHLRAVRKEQGDLRERHGKGEKLVIAGREEAGKLRESLNDRKKELEDVQQAMPDMKVLSDIREWYNMQQHIGEENARLREEIAGVEKELHLIQRDVEIIQQQHPAFKGVPPLDCPALQRACQEERERVGTDIKKIRDEWMHQNSRQRLADFAGELSEGEPCPLCGALSHPAPLHAAEVAEDLKVKAARIEALENEEKQLDRIASRLTVINERGQSALERREQLTRKLKAVEEKLRAHRSRFTWEKYPADDLQMIMREINRTTLLNEKKRELEKTCKLTEEAIERKRVELEKYIARLDEINREVVQRDSRVELLRGQLAGFDVAAYEDMPDTGIQRELETCRERFERVGSEYQRDFEKSRAIEAEYRKLEGSVEEKSKEVIRLQREFAERDERLKELLKGSVYKNAGDLRRYLTESTFDVSGARERIRQYEQRLHVLEVRIAELRALLEGVSHDVEVFEAFEEGLRALKEREQVILAKLGALENQIKDMETRVAAREKIGKELEGLELRLANLQMLKGLFRGNDFVKFVSSMYLQNLCNAANERFYRMTRQRLKLELSEDNDFIVRDFMNEGRTRSARTLSGGQVFQASLSLALALTDNIRHLTGSNQNFFFLDEGFGSLDRESLGVVFDTLKSLRAENRVVGLISHVEEMQQEIPVCLFVENSVEEGSTIRIEN